MLIILTSHPIQYQAPLWRAMAEDGRVPFEVWFLTDHAVKSSHDREFGRAFAWDRDLLSGYPHRFLPIRSGWRLDRFHGIKVSESWAKLFKDSKVTHLWVEGWRFWENWAAIFAARRLGIKVLLRGETNDLRPRSGLREWCRRFVLKRLFSRVDHFLCIGTANRRFYQSFGIPKNKLVATPYCVDNKWFALEADRIRSQRQIIRKRWRIPENAFCILFCGKFIPKKRPMDLIHAASRIVVNSNDRPLHLLFVGSGLLGSELRQACSVVFDADESTVRSEIAPDESRPQASFTGFLNQGEICQAYVAADCLALLSDTGETWGLVANEAMASGLPCIASNQCGCAEDLIQPLNPQGVFPTGDVQALSRAIEAQALQTSNADGLKSWIDRFDIRCTVEAVFGALTEKSTKCH